MITEPAATQDLHLRYEWDRAEFARGIRAVARNVETRGWARFWYVLPAIMLSWGVVDVMTRNPANQRAVLGTVIPAIIFIALMLLFIRLAPRLTARSVERQNSLRGRMVTATLDGRGYTTDNGLSQSSAYWSAFVRAVETPEFILFYYNQKCAYYLPRRAIPPGQSGAVRAIIREHMGDRATLLND